LNIKKQFNNSLKIFKKKKNHIIYIYLFLHIKFIKLFINFKNVQKLNVLI
jgi:hypothetical protein